MFYGIKVWPFYCMKLKLGKVGVEGWRSRDALPQLLRRDLTACITSGIFCLQCRRSASGVTHSSSCLENTAGKEAQLRVRGGEAMGLTCARGLLKACWTVLTKLTWWHNG